MISGYQQNGIQSSHILHCSAVLRSHIWNSRCIGQGQCVKNLGDVEREEGWLLEPELGRRTEAPLRALAMVSNGTKAPSQPKVWSWEGNRQPSRPTRHFPRAQMSKSSVWAQHWADPDLTFERLQPWPLFSAHVDLSGLSFPVSIPLPTLGPSGFCGTGPSPNPWGGLWPRPSGTHGTQLQVFCCKCWRREILLDVLRR